MYKKSSRRLATLAACGLAMTTATFGNDIVAGAADPPAEITVTMGGSNASSSVYALLSAHARLASEADGAMTINMRETGSSAENVQLLETDAIQFGINSLGGLTSAYLGFGQYDGEPHEDLRLLMNFIVNSEFLIVRADQGIETIYDLDGTTIAPGFQGSVTYDAMLAYLGALGIEVEVFDGGLEDIVNAMKDGRIVGYGKSGNGDGADATMLDVASAVPVQAIGFTQDDIDTIMAADPTYEQLYQFHEVPAGSIFDNPEPFLTPVLFTSYMVSERLPEETAYRLAAGLNVGLEEAAQQTNYAGAIGIAPALTADNADIVPLHPGAERWYREQGHL